MNRNIGNVSLVLGIICGTTNGCAPGELEQPPSTEEALASPAPRSFRISRGSFDFKVSSYDGTVIHYPVIFSQNTSTLWNPAIPNWANYTTITSGNELATCDSIDNYRGYGDAISCADPHQCNGSWVSCNVAVPASASGSYGPADYAAERAKFTDPMTIGFIGHIICKTTEFGTTHERFLDSFKGIAVTAGAKNAAVNAFIRPYLDPCADETDPRLGDEKDVFLGYCAAGTVCNYSLPDPPGLFSFKVTVGDAITQQQ